MQVCYIENIQDGCWLADAFCLDRPAPPSRMSPNTKPPSCVGLINEWLRICLEDHEICQAAAKSITNSRWVPSRLIDVGCGGSGISQRLVVTADTLSGEEKIQ